MTNMSIFTFNNTAINPFLYKYNHDNHDIYQNNITPIFGEWNKQNRPLSE